MALIQIKTTKKPEQNSEYVLGFLKILWPQNSQSSFLINSGIQKLIFQQIKPKLDSL